MTFPPRKISMGATWPGEYDGLCHSSNSKLAHLHSAQLFLKPIVIIVETAQVGAYVVNTTIRAVHECVHHASERNADGDYRADDPHSVRAHTRVSVPRTPEPGTSGLFETRRTNGFGVAAARTQPGTLKSRSVHDWGSRYDALPAARSHTAML